MINEREVGIGVLTSEYQKRLSIHDSLFLTCLKDVIRDCLKVISFVLRSQSEYVKWRERQIPHSSWIMDRNVRPRVGARHRTRVIVPVAIRRARGVV